MTAWLSVAAMCKRAGEGKPRAVELSKNGSEATAEVCHGSHYAHSISFRFLGDSFATLESRWRKCAGWARQGIWAHSPWIPLWCHACWAGLLMHFLSVACSFPPVLRDGKPPQRRDWIYISFFWSRFFSQHAQEFAFTANKSQYDYILILELGHNYWICLKWVDNWFGNERCSFLPSDRTI